jgi:hypothetical protein
LSRWIAVEVGCIECGEPSTVLGPFASKDDAEAEVDTECLRGLVWEVPD